MEREAQKLIIGGGLTSLIFAFYNRDYTIISPNVGGQVKNSGGIGPVYLQKNQYTEKFLNDLGVNANIRKIKIGFLTDKDVKGDVDIESKKRYLAKSRSLNSIEEVEIKEDTLNADKLNFEAYDVNWAEIIQAIEPHVNIIQGEVKKINTKDKKVTIRQYMRGKDIEYSELISTIPLYNFFNIIDEQRYTRDLRNTTTDICYAISETVPIKKKHTFDYLYDVSENNDFYRVTCQSDGKFIYEFTGQQVLELLQKKYFKFGIIDIVNVPFGKVIKDLNITQYGDTGILLLGMYAQINHSAKIEYICEFAQQFANNSSDEE